ncbi:hypothetical protein HPB48_022390 [Haemaphysalis longicornis]|uniref:Uncharacterized protein n=1 Tax=Haemaphysalis longicornis TaxID=44386 RepID=A0A9J6GSK0_HAELO|nr:hypothetical protein HPB48_022390 [Haemaphysalis longicornis]
MSPSTSSLEAPTPAPAPTADPCGSVLHVEKAATARTFAPTEKKTSASSAAKKTPSKIIRANQNANYAIYHTKQPARTVRNAFDQLPPPLHIRERFVRYPEYSSDTSVQCPPAQETRSTLPQDKPR